MKHASEKTFDIDLQELLKKTKRVPTLSIKEILTTLSGKSRALVLIFLSLPFCQPIQIPGMSIPFGIVIGLIGLRMAFGKRLWLPKMILQKEITSAKIQKIIVAFLRIMKKTDPFIRVRLKWLCDHGKMKIVNGLVLLFLGISLAIPIPFPLTNIVAGWSIFLISIGLLEDDGVFVISGYVLSFIALLFFILLFFSIETFFNH